MDNIVEIKKRKADTCNRVLLPNYFIEENGKEYKMIIYQDKIELIPIKKYN